jgi:tRNA-Thr(GGU) m(6)t(6)A37 methyltransferase TsaA
VGARDFVSPKARREARFSGRDTATPSEDPRMDRIQLTVIGTVRNGRESSEDLGWGPLESTIELRPEYADGLLGLEQFSHAIVLFFMDRDPDHEPPVLRRRPRGRADMPLLGVFAQRARMRPNRVGITAVEIVRIEAAAAVVRGLDALDGTPVLDLKPYVPVFDRRDGARAPEWITRLMEGYF